ncbi:GMC oxidoreductase [Hymenobacter glacieicola]|uniref:GMC oxidoreductase n=1 Tax=Hymenobacter glacieicola TaxID=1562124 RepID=A0ABQ1X5U9_9BACT|nr:GMC family oxidoreductase [Hymenobacter glacieicola]GGG57576.1 GMC oxidoreductase [Hymenobacter glacieicola]
MIISKNTFEEGQTLTADLCLIGSGPAAISIALSLENSPLRVLVLTGGGWTETLANQDLYRGVVPQAGTHEPLEENRRRQFGGSSAAWGGRCIPFEPLDFKPRAWVPDSGWPISYEELLPYYHQAAEVCQIGRFEFDGHQAFPKGQREILAGMDSEELTSGPLERWSPPVHFAKTYRERLESSRTIQVLLDAHVLSLEMEDDHSTTVGHVNVRMEGRNLRVQARQFVLATGGIENARLLLASTSARFPTGLGNQHDNVGRYYMAHICGVYTDIRLHDNKKLQADFERDAGGVYCRRRWWIPEPAQEAHHLLNTIFFLYHAKNENGHRDVLFSSRFVAKSLLFILSQGRKSVSRGAQQARQQLPALREHLANILRNGLTEIPDLVKLGFKRMAKRRVPYLLPSRRNPYWGLYIQAEQAPNRESRICLSATEKDAFGMPRAEVKLAFLESDVESVVQAHKLFVERFKALNLGEINCEEADLRDHIRKHIGSFNSSAHHIGTTRMSEDPRTGVVDKHAKVHGLDNLYVAGSSVFPTGGHANPTLTIVAHALLLAHHLKTEALAPVREAQLVG